MRKRLFASAGLLVIAAWLSADGRARADTHILFTGSVNGMLLEDIGFDQDIWLSATNARWDQSTWSIIINYELERVLLLSHDRRTYVETRWPFDLAEIMPLARRLFYTLGEIDFKFEEAASGEECERGIRASFVEQGQSQILCLVDSLPQVEIKKVIDLQTIHFKVTTGREGAAELLAAKGGAIVKMVVAIKLGYQETRISLELDSIREEEPAWNLYGIPAGYRKEAQLDWEEMMVGIRGGVAPSGATGSAGPSFFTTGRNRLQIRSGHRGPVTAVHYVEDGRLALTGGADGTIRLWDAGTGREMLRASVHEDPVTAIDAPNSMMAVSGDSKGNMCIWSLFSGELQADRKYHRGITSLRWSIEQERLLISTDSRVALAVAMPRCDTASLLRARQETGEWPSQCTEVEPNPRQTLKFVGGTRFTRIRSTPDGAFIATANRGGVTAVWNGEDGAEIWRHQASAAINDLAFSADGRHLAAVDAEGSFRVWTTTGEMLLQLPAHRGAATAVRFLAENRVATAGRDGRVRVWNLPERRATSSFELPGGAVRALAVAAGGEFLLAGSEDGGARHLRVSTGETVQVFRGFATPVEDLWFLDDGRALAVSSGDFGTALWDLREGVRVHGDEPDSPPRRHGSAPEAAGPDESWWASGDRVTVRQLSADGRFILAGTADGRLGIFEAESGEPVFQVDSRASAIKALALSPEGRFLASATDDDRVELWDVATETRVVSLVQFVDGSWLVADDEGRYDSDRPGDLPGVAWVLASQPLEAFPVELFLRDYFTPGLLARRFLGADLPEIEKLDSRNLLRPTIEITAIERRDEDPAEVDVVVEVENRVVDPRMGVVSGVEDLRLFRDGRLVGVVPPDGGALRPDTDPTATRASIRFERIRLPADKSTPTVSFEAYAFNSDRIKSDTAHRPLMLPAELPPRPGKAYLIHVGVSDYRDDRLDLTYAAADARLFGSALQDALHRLGTYEEIASMVLVAEESNDSTWGEKAHLREALGRLAGRPADTALPEGEQLRLASPEDLVLISLAGHGVVDRRGIFYFLPADFRGAREGGLEAWDLSGAVSSDELARWLQDVDAAEIVLIVDACYSAATVDSQDFRPGPMGSRGLGELAYNKGMRVLTATQSDAVAIESDRVRHGLLTYALVEEGLVDGLADLDPPDGQLHLGEWLAYAVARVPELHRQIKRGHRGGIPLVESQISQVPRLFDFARDGVGPVLRRDLPTRLGRRSEP